MNYVDWDPFDPKASEDPQAEYARLRGECPVARSDRFGGFWTLSRYAHVRKASVDHSHFMSSRRPFVHLPEMESLPLTLNPPEHTPIRRALNRYFAQKQMLAMEPRIRRNVVALLKPLVASGQGEMAGFADALTVQVLCEFLNLPSGSWVRIQEMGGTLREIVARNMSAAREEAAAVEPEDVSLAAEMQKVLAAEVGKLIADRKEEPLDPESDIVSGLLADEDIPDDVILGIGATLFGAGFDTTKSAICAAIYHLASNAADQAKLRKDPLKIPLAVEEFLRWQAPLECTSRRAAADAEVDGHPIPEGDLVSLSWASANLDPEQFENPETLDIERTPNLHLTFGHGVHKCVGAPLARLEIQIVLEELLGLTQSFALGGNALNSSTTFFQNGYEQLPLALIA